MPQFAVSPVPVQVSQSITDPALIQNLGDTNVYLDVISSVSIAAYSIVLGPRDSINWKANTPLWAATATGNKSNLSVLYGADGAALGSVNVIGTVNIDGDVHLDGPIEIAGPVTVDGTVDIGNIVQTTVTNTVSTNVANTVTTTVEGTVDTVITGPVEIEGTVPISGNVGITGPVTVSGAVDINGTVPIDGDVTVTGPVTVSNVVAIDGTVDIDLPVNVQGGGTILRNSIIDVPAISGTTPGEFTVDITAPPDGLTYYGIRFQLTLASTGLQSGKINCVTVYGYSGGTTLEFITSLCRPGSGAPVLGQLGLPATHIFSVPMTADYPYRLVLTNRDTTVHRMQIRAFGISVAPTAPTTDFSTNLTSGNPYYGEIPWTQNRPFLLPPSFQDYSVRLYQGASSTLTSVSLNRIIEDGTTDTVGTQIQATETSAGSMPQQTSRVWNVVGTGYPMALMSSSPSNTGLGYLGFYSHN